MLTLLSTENLFKLGGVYIWQIRLGAGVRPSSNVTSEEIQKRATAAGFEPQPTDNPAQFTFARAPYTLVVNKDATWTCHTDVTGNRKVFHHGYTFTSLLEFLRNLGRFVAVAFIVVVAFIWTL